MSKQKSTPCAGYLPPWRIAGVPKETSVLLALSGGADSRALLHLLYEGARCDGFALTLAHVNHGIRGEEAWRDRDFCCGLAASYGLEICVLDADVPALAAKNGRGLEEEARSVRYAYFETLMRERNIPLLVTAHHADDNLETLLFRLCRGTGLQGLGGIAPMRPFANGTLVRPLLHCPRREILAYCKANGLQYVTDSTNTDTAYARNRIRAEVIPVLETLFDDLQVRTSDMAEELREDEAYLRSVAQDLLERILTPQGIDVKDLQALPLPIRKRVLRTWVKETCGRESERVHIDALLDLIDVTEENGAQVALPRDFFAVREFGNLRLMPRSEGESIDFFFPFTVGETLLENSKIRLTVQRQEDHRKIHNLSTQTCIIRDDFSDIIKKGLYWRSRRAGDVILQGGMHRKLRKLYNAEKVPARLRDRLPILCDSEGIVWAPFVGCRDGLPQKGNTYVVSIRLPDQNDK